MKSSILCSSILSVISGPAFAVEPWLMVEKFTFTNDPITYRGQGVTTDGTNWYFSGTNALEITDSAFNPILRVNPGIAPALAIPSELAAKGLNHIGDIDYANGLLYVSLDTTNRDPVGGGQYNTPVFAIYNADDLTYTGQAYALSPPHGVQDIASWVAVDAKNGVGYGMAYDNATEIAVYNLDDWSFQKYIPLQRTIDQAQGGKLLDGWMYFSSENDTKAIYRANLETGEVEELARLDTPGDQEVEGLSFNWTPDGWSLYVLNREQPTPDVDESVGFYRYLRPYGNVLSGEVHASVQGAFIQDSRVLRDVAGDRIRSAFDAVAAPSMPVAAYGDDGLEALPGNAGTDGLVMWSQMLGIAGSASGAGDAAGFDHTTGGLLVGADTSVGGWRFGVLTGYSETSFDVDARASSGTADNVHLGLYAGTEWGALGFRTGATYAWHSVETTRNVVFPAFSERLSADYDAATAQAFGELGYRFDLNPTVLEPFANVAYVRLETDGFSETGGTTAALISEDDTMETAFTTIGLRASSDMPFGPGRAVMRGMIGWQHAYGDITPDSRFAFNTGASFDSPGAPIDEDALSLEAGFDLSFTPSATLGASYSGQIGDDAQGHAFKLNLNLKL